MRLSSGLRHVALGGGLLTLATALSLSGLQAQVNPDLLSAMRARSIGPAGMSGRITTIAALESDPDLVYAGAASGGVWKSLNGGDTWTPVFEHQRVAGIGAIAVHPRFRDVVWVGTGEGNPRNSADVGAGVYRSLDGGETWQFLGLEATRQIHRIVLDPDDPDVAWVGAMGPLWSDGDQRGVFKTTDGGKTWRNVLFVDERTGVSDMVQDPRDPNKIFVGMWSFRRYPWAFESGGEGSGVYVTRDGGDTWTRLSDDVGLPGGTLGRIGLAIAHSDPDVVYALIEAEADRGLYRSDDGGATWQVVNTDRSVLSRPFYFTDIFVDPQNELRLYNLSSRVTISEDGGRSFQPMRSDVHSDFHALWIDPSDSRHLYIGTDGGLFISHDRAHNWRVVDNLPVGQFYYISVDMDIPFHVYGGMQDNGSWKGPSDAWDVDGIRNFEWVETAFGDGFNSMVDPREPFLGYAMSQGGNLTRFDVRTGERKGIRPYHPDPDQELRFNWNAALAMDPFDVGTIYYGSQFLHRSRDRGDSWETISGDLTTNDPEKQKQDESGGLTRDATGAENHTTIITIAPSPVERGVIWVGTDDGNVQLTRDGGANWSNLVDRIKGPPAATWVPHIEASKHAAGTAYVVFDDHRRGGWTPWIFRTTDYGESWQNIAAGIDGYVLTIEEDPVEPSLLFAGSEFGLWVSVDGGGHWFKWTHGFPTVPVRAMVVHPRDSDLAIATFGRALYILDDIRPLRALAAGGGTIGDAVRLIETPDAYLRRVRAMNGYHFSADALFKGETRPAGALLSYWVSSGGPGRTATVTILDQAGNQVRQLQGSATTGLNRLTWDLRADPPGGPPAPRPAGPPGRRGGGGGFFGGGAGGPEVLPGDYVVRVALGEDVSEQPLRVHPDPRVDVATADRQAKYEAVVEGLTISQRLTAAQDKVQEVSGAVDKVLEFVSDEEGDAFEVVRTAGEALKKALAEDVDLGAANRQRRGVFGLQSTWEAPTEAERIALDRFATAVAGAEARVNAVLAEQGEAFRAAVRSAGVGMVPEFTPLGGSGSP